MPNHVFCAEALIVSVAKIIILYMYCEYLYDNNTFCVIIIIILIFSTV